MVFAGPDQPPAGHALAYCINDRLGAFGNGIVAVAPVRIAEGIEPVDALVAAMAAGRMRRLAILDCNPASDAPADLAFDTLAARVPATLPLGISHDETARVCRWHAPHRPALESQGDDRKRVR